LNRLIPENRSEQFFRRIQSEKKPSLRLWAPLITHKITTFQHPFKAITLTNFESMTVLGVSNKDGITVTDHKKSKDLSKYQVIGEYDFAYNPYRINVGSIGLVPRGVKGLVSPAYVVFRTKDDLLPELLFDFLKSEEGLFQISKYARGTVRKALRFDDLCQIEMPVPCIEVQRSILRKKESIEIETSQLATELTHQQTLLKKLRQQILQEVIEGKLTADWRKQNPDIEPASELLARIQEEKAQLIKEKKIRIQKTLPPISEEEKPFELPEGWVWCRLGDFGEIKGGGTPSKGNPDFWDGDIPWVCPKDMKKKFINKSICQITEIAIGKSSAKIISKDSVLFVVRGMILSHTFPVAINTDSITINQDMKALSPCISNMSEYLYLVLTGSSLRILKQVKTSTHGTCRLESEVYFNWVVALPPLPEQKAIVNKVEKLLALCDQLETQITNNQTHAEQLMQAVLKEAFTQGKDTPEKALEVS
ncbi:MAG: hypothetical protein D3903_00515, partial [Candidatus Electrothrix sp. GM3_4]|nr:hypothetical protein [Candidatus Electrothrix sp. GM3_4]